MSGQLFILQSLPKLLQCFLHRAAHTGNSETLAGEVHSSVFGHKCQVIFSILPPLSPPPLLLLFPMQHDMLPLLW